MLCNTSDLTGEFVWTVGDGQAKVKFVESSDHISLELIVVPAECRGQGLGGYLLDHLIHYSRLLDKRIHVVARPIGGRTNPERLERLIRFYKKHGFIETERGVTVCRMTRSHTPETVEGK